MGKRKPHPTFDDSPGGLQVHVSTRMRNIETTSIPQREVTAISPPPEAPLDEECEYIFDVAPPMPIAVAELFVCSASGSGSGSGNSERWVHVENRGWEASDTHGELDCCSTGSGEWNRDESRGFDEERSADRKWFHQPVYRCVFFGFVILDACVLLAVAIALPIYLQRQASSTSIGLAPSFAPSKSPETRWPVSLSPSEPTPIPTSVLTPEQIACNFLGRQSLEECRSTSVFDTYTNTSTDFVVGSTIPSEIGLLTQLTSLLLDKSNLSGTLPSALSNLTRLTMLSMSSNELKGTIPSTLGSLTRLTALWLDNNRFKGEIPSSLFPNLIGLNTLVLSNNYLLGTIPSSISNLTQLEYLDFSSNQLSGSIQSSISQLTSLESLYLYENTLTGSIPSFLGAQTKLTFVNLYQNFLTGTIPTSLFNLIQLTGLSLSRNRLGGSIPTSIGDLTNLVILMLDHNDLTGTIPVQISNLVQQQRTYFSLDNTSLSGSIPSTLCTESALIYVDCGEVQCNCCLDPTSNLVCRR